MVVVRTSCLPRVRLIVGLKSIPRAWWTGVLAFNEQNFEGKGDGVLIQTKARIALVTCRLWAASIAQSRDGEEGSVFACKT